MFETHQLPSTGFGQIARAACVLGRRIEFQEVWMGACNECIPDLTSVCVELHPCRNLHLVHGYTMTVTILNLLGPS
jgi:hypothetical protein